MKPSKPPRALESCSPRFLRPWSTISSLFLRVMGRLASAFLLITGEKAAAAAFVAWPPLRPPPIHRMNERMNGRGAFRGRYPARRIADPDGRLGHPPPGFRSHRRWWLELLFLRPPRWKEVEMIRLFQGVN